MLARIGFLLFNVCGVVATILLVGASGEDKFMKKARTAGKVLAVVALVGFVIFVLKY